ncbi:MAG: hypothetical protein K9L22_08305 [Methylococcaceae bacterium]|nr:hypothetical protein [Methylococcaceae bacterium]
MKTTVNKDSQESSNLKSLIAQPQRLSCIDKVSLHLNDILSAREKKVTWQVIADTLNLQRPTLINAVKTLTTKNQKTTVESVTSNQSQSPKQTVHSINNTNQRNNLHEQTTNYRSDLSSAAFSGIKAIGRSKLEDFNLDN